MKEIFGINDTFYNIFDIKYIIRRYSSNDYDGFSITVENSSLPIYINHTRNQLNTTILQGYQINNKLPFKFVVKEPESFKKEYPELGNIIKYLKNL